MISLPFIIPYKLCLPLIYLQFVLDHESITLQNPTYSHYTKHNHVLRTQCQQSLRDLRFRERFKADGIHVRSEKDLQH